MKKTWMVFALAAVLMSGSLNLFVQETAMCACNLTGAPAVQPPDSLRLGIILVQFGAWATNTDVRDDRCHAHLEDNHYTYQELSQPMLNFCNHRKNVRAFSQHICL